MTEQTLEERVATLRMRLRADPLLSRRLIGSLDSVRDDILINASSEKIDAELRSEGLDPDEACARIYKLMQAKLKGMRDRDARSV